MAWSLHVHRLASAREDDMAELNDSLNQLLEGQTSQISRRIGADEADTRTAMRAAVPALLAAFGDEAERGGGLRQAIEQDHDGAILDQLSEYLGGSAQLSPRTTNGAGILEHVLGDRQPDMQRALSAKSGLDAGNIGSLLALLAPIVMGMLGKRGQTSGSSGFGLDDLSDLLGREKRDATSGNPDIGDVLGGLLGGKR
ncbi:MAG: DUF937 domain-containing protein [Chloroflexi bacterium]|nr:DUF937 domain-containing protein [Chloroflexota bacterium]